MIFLFQVWDLDTLQCIMTLNAHSDVVMSLICWDQFLLSCSLDCTIKVWVATEGGNLEVTYTHNEEHVCFPFTKPFPLVMLCSYGIMVVRV